VDGACKPFTETMSIAAMRASFETSIRKPPASEEEFRRWYLNLDAKGYRDWISF
jgi:hypothetical protein